jgi:hypothetical protein
MSWVFSEIVEGKENERGRRATGGTFANAREYKPLFTKEKQDETNESRERGRVTRRGNGTFRSDLTKNANTEM